MAVKKTKPKTKQSLKDGEVRKNVDIPKGELKVLERLADKERMNVKPYMERVLIHHAKENE